MRSVKMERLPANPNKPKHQETFVFECLSSRAEASGKFCFIDYIFQIWKRSLRTRHGNNSAPRWPTRQRVSALEGAGGWRVSCLPPHKHPPARLLDRLAEAAPFLSFHRFLMTFPSESVRNEPVHSCTHADPCARTARKWARVSAA